MAAEGGGSNAAHSNTQSQLLEDRVAIVTGSSRGLGRHIALHLGSVGARIVINYTSNAVQAETVAAEINASSPNSSHLRAITFRADVSDPTQVKSLFDEAEQAFNSPVHILVNSAGVLDSKYPSIADTSLQDFDYIFSVNARGAFLCSREAANRLKRGGGGRIILFSSSLVNKAITNILAKEIKGTGITANCIALGPIATELFFAGRRQEHVNKVIQDYPLGKLGEAKDVAPVVGFLATDTIEWVNDVREAFLCCKEAANKLKRGGGGRIILLSLSLVASLKPRFGSCMASMTVVEAMTQVLAKELKGTGIAANCIVLGPIATEMFFAGRSEKRIIEIIGECPMGRLGETKDVASMVGFWPRLPSE